ncbi:FAD-dependent 5-carboxymethylaminomethyl-2-thiouridine(34) oxidoreductase MnmC [Shewanella intestini]|uniref:FAD-dependent 5-carboxymethylaminomethyl-2-thiouridine(34) oxidoreductase MnmC n=1 Tax=Shewanella intestini TaxID=2017544 RepID=A0ABS5HYV6_9GAMM|nr:MULTISPECIES: FAD-dependent 5-carboxymethylaminomethyl-2-thiouridine(34) oxidoreductase MnmC [Shewanella]MBR9726912.1 FAD-dependent 5-carboxymethylaminomethyl-2-thiouridine(34) oxidoreductase MnmC [Shewanella intestini]MRG34522.1 FAD-dependent 5-carboxymethylaminomethyl-2-thiouridine(34) oxidoreductase MnmC [Shewanella sp. XMDDZSB0408]
MNAKGVNPLSRINLADLFHTQSYLQLGIITHNPIAALQSMFNQLEQINQKRIHISVLSKSKISSIDPLWQHIAQSSVTELATSLSQQHVANINGCQRMSLNNGQITVDIYQYTDNRTVNDMLADIITPHIRFQHWLLSCDTLSSVNSDHYLQQAIFWQCARLSADHACVSILAMDTPSGVVTHQRVATSDTIEAVHDQDVVPANISKLQLLCRQTGFRFIDELSNDIKHHDNAIELAERQALRQQQLDTYAYNPLPQPNMPPSSVNNSVEEPLTMANRQSIPNHTLNTAQKKIDPNSDTIAIVGGGIASAFLALSLAKRGKKITLYCQDDAIAQGASANKQGAIYPLLTPDNGPLSQFFQQAYLFSRHQIDALLNQGHPISHDFCGVFQTGFDPRSQQRLDKIINAQQWPSNIAVKVNAQQANELTQVDVNKGGFYYPLGGWVCPYELTQAAIKQAMSLTQLELVFNTHVDDVQYIDNQWHVYGSHLSSERKNATQLLGHHSQLVIASGANINQLSQTAALPLTPFRGQVSHIPTQGQLNQLSSVICANGYLTPQHEHSHCVGASYIKHPQDLAFSELEQQQNQQKMAQSFPDSHWPKDIDTHDNQARVGVRMVSRDHFPVMGAMANVAQIQARFEQQRQLPQWQQSPKYWQQNIAPHYQQLYVLGGFGSRGISSAPLVAESLAAMMTGELSPLGMTLQTLLSPNRMWMRKLLKGKAI